MSQHSFLIRISRRHPNRLVGSRDWRLQRLWVPLLVVCVTMGFGAIVGLGGLNVLQLITILAGVAGIVLVLLCPQWGVYAMVAMLWLSPFFVATGGLTLNRALGAVTLVGVLAQRATRRDRRPLRFDVFDAAVLTFVGVMLLSAVVNGVSLLMLGYVWDYLMGYVIFWLFRDQITNRDRLHTVLAILIVAPLIAGWPTVLFALGGSATTLDRVIGIMQVNAMGREAWVGLIALLWLASQRIWARAIVVPLVAVLSVIMFLSGSRTAMISLGVALFVLAWLLHGRWRLYVLVTLALLVLGYLGTQVLAPGAVKHALNIFPAIDTLFGGDANDVRVVLWRKSLLLFSERPLFGWGLGSFNDLVPSAAPLAIEVSGLMAHSLLFSTLAELGLAGVIALVFLFLSAFRRAVGQLAKLGDSGISGLVFAICLATAHNGIILFSGDQIVDRPMFVMFALLAVATMLHRGAYTDPTKHVGVRSSAVHAVRTEQERYGQL